eukprot:TRINITY_DN4143_c0_g2_i1.p1 TRINITY_DN4143_c0_g2~~TRINITY_DN4143_c0_g2_i1.p1  ORF type:complete len:100 (+),score=7.89 TRINITY_DN4143_c0_g2_i1:153-452(+)
MESVFQEGVSCTSSKRRKGRCVMRRNACLHRNAVWIVSVLPTGAGAGGEECCKGVTFRQVPSPKKHRGWCTLYSTGWTVARQNDKGACEHLKSSVSANQ